MIILNMNLIIVRYVGGICWMQNKNKELKTITQEKLDELIKNHNRDDGMLDLTGYYFKDVDIKMWWKVTIDFSNSRFENCTFKNVKLVDCKFHDVKIKDSLFVNVKLENIDIKDSFIRDSEFYCCEFNKGIFSFLQTFGIELVHCTVDGLKAIRGTSFRYLSVKSSVIKDVICETVHSNFNDYSDCEIRGLMFFAGGMNTLSFKRCKLFKCDFGGIHSELGQKPYGNRRDEVSFKLVEMFDCSLIKCTGLEISALINCKVEGMEITNRVINTNKVIRHYSFKKKNNISNNYSFIKDNHFVQCDFTDYPYYLMIEEEHNNKLVNCYCDKEPIANDSVNRYNFYIGRH